MTLTTIELLAQDSTIGRARVADVLASGVTVNELFRLSRLGLIDLLPAARPLAEKLPTVPGVDGQPVQLEYCNLI